MNRYTPVLSIVEKDGHTYFVFSDEEEAEWHTAIMLKCGCHHMTCFGGYYNAWVMYAV